MLKFKTISGETKSMEPWRASNPENDCVIETQCSPESLQAFTDEELLERLKRYVASDRQVTVQLLLHLGEVEARGLHCAKGCSSLFVYCVERLGFSEDVAYKRVGAARLCRQFPEVVPLLASGELHLTALMLVRPYLTRENHRDWLNAACGKTKRQVELLVATRMPKPNVVTSIRKLPNSERLGHGVSSKHSSVFGTREERDSRAPVEIEPNSLHAGALANAPEVSASPEKSVCETRAGVPAPVAKLSPLSATSYRVVFTASDELKHKIDRASELLSHSVAPNDIPAILGRALDLLIQAEEQRRFAIRVSPLRIAVPMNSTQVNRAATNSRQIDGQQSNGQQSNGQQSNGQQSNGQQSNQPCARREETRKEPRSERVGGAPFEHIEVPRRRKRRYVPAAVRRAVWSRDDGRCAFTDAEGHRCAERRLLQIEHREPWALGGSDSVDNCELLCAAHNAHRARPIFGDGYAKSELELVAISHG